MYRRALSRRRIAALRPSPRSSPSRGEADAKRQVRVRQQKARHSLPVRSLNWQLRFFPCFPTTLNIPKLFKTQRFQNARRDARAITAAAINGSGLGLIEFFYSLAQFRNKDVKRAGNMSLLPFAGRTDVEN